METTEKSGDEKKQYAARLPNRKYGYFRDDQIVLLVTHNEAVIPEAALTTNTDHLNEVLNEMDAVVSSEPQVITFPRLSKETGENGQENMLSTLTYAVEKAPEDPSYLTTIIENYNKLPKDKTNMGATPNWLTSVASQGAGTGGPGGRPSPFHGSRAKAPYRFYDLIERLQDAGRYGNGAGVDVAILDTAPCAHDLVAAPKEWPDHPIISTLLGPGGKLHLYPAPYDEVVRLGNTSLNDHDYKMTDHGLFVAGIIHSIVPEAEIHLIEVLNQYGMGDLTSFVRGLETVHTKIYNSVRRLVINCSWMLELPYDELHARHTNQEDPDAHFEQKVLEFCRNDEYGTKATALMLKTLFDEFVAVNRMAIAAAGNDGREGDSRRSPARYPAALQNVVGVGALPKTLEKKNGKYRTSVYSNLGDAPGKNGIMTVGGEEGEGKGVLGVYLGEFPDGRPNTSKWAWWSGTSFATPIVTGATAAVLSSPDAPRSTVQAIATLTEFRTQADATRENERVMAVTQT